MRCVKKKQNKMAPSSIKPASGLGELQKGMKAEASTECKPLPNVQKILIDNIRPKDPQ